MVANRLLEEMYLKGHGVPQHFERSQEHYKEARRGGGLEATANLGVLYGRQVRRSSNQMREPTRARPESMPRRPPNAFKIFTEEGAAQGSELQGQKES